MRSINSCWRARRAADTAAWLCLAATDVENVQMRDSLRPLLERVRVDGVPLRISVCGRSQSFRRLALFDVVLGRLQCATEGFAAESHEIGPLGLAPLGQIAAAAAQQFAQSSIAAVIVVDQQRG